MVLIAEVLSFKMIHLSSHILRAFTNLLATKLVAFNTHFIVIISRDFMCRRDKKEKINFTPQGLWPKDL